MSTPEDLTPGEDQLSIMKARADKLGVTYHPSIGLEKLTEKVNAAMASDAPEEKAPAAAPVEAPVKTEAQIQQDLQMEASKLVRIRVTCMNPNKKEWEGEIFTVGNSVVGTFKKYVPFNADEGWHVPHIIYEHLLHRECQTFVTTTDGRGNKTRRGKLIREFAIEVLPQLTPEELEELARRQAMANSVG